ncbi:MAG TPA: FAD-binding oxidoreductase [Rhodopila sp.]|nr:FAD-binding oxidoreductase [Rhodopila sp.]
MESEFDIVVIGAGMAGASAAAFLAEDRRVALLEAEETAGYHTTGRSAAMWIENYGPPDVRALTRQSRAFFEHPPEGFAQVPLFRRRPVLLLATPAQEATLDAAIASGHGLRRIAAADAQAMVPALRPGYLGAAGLEEDAFDIDVAALHQGFLRQLRSCGGELGLRRRAGRIERQGDGWHVEAASGDVYRAPIVVNAAGAWGDQVAGLAGAAPLGLEPRRRTAAILDPSPHDVSDWPMIIDIEEQWYARPEARTRLMVSPADETPTHAHDVQPEEIDVAVGIDRMQQALDIPVSRVEHRWAGLRTFSPDGSLAIGWDAVRAGFFWCAGQGGYGIQTAPAAGRLVADLVRGRTPQIPEATLAAVAPQRFSRDS